MEADPCRRQWSLKQRRWISARRCIEKASEEADLGGAKIDEVMALKNMELELTPPMVRGDLELGEEHAAYVGGQR
ncbi:hypothetical protein E2562_024988 [Oryza meyeriana var. granulata]|uniref:Uncharacterized protein n=1 Tax=Oryza meyeriana var. granulata TaxID=110450 RepID=A0A6G1FBY0_9ORYZ|nr:hypothetical protein E2562_024988 [Oryza meyeriana var. granulata]